MANEIMQIQGIDCYEENGTAYLKLESVARGLGFTRIAESGNEVVRWERVDGYLADLSVPTCGHDGYIPENIFYRLAMKEKRVAALTTPPLCEPIHKDIGIKRKEIVMEKAMLSQPMAGKTDEEIKRTRERAIKALESMGYEVVNTLFSDAWYSKEAMEQRGVVQIPLCFLAKSLENMSLCHVAYFCKGWEVARGCRIEHEAAQAYGLKILEEEEL